MPFPPLPEQQRIAAYLDASCAAIDAAVAAKRRQLETLDALRKSIDPTRCDTGISARVALESLAMLDGADSRGWKLVCLKRIAEIQGGLTLGKQYEGPLIERPLLACRQCAGRPSRFGGSFRDRTPGQRSGER